MVTSFSSAEGLDPISSDIPFPSVESVDEDFEPDEILTNEILITGINVNPNERSPTPATSETPAIVSPQPIRRPNANREDSLYPPSTNRDLYNATPRSTPTPAPSIPDTTSIAEQDSIETHLAQLNIRPGPATEPGFEQRQEYLLSQLAALDLGSPEPMVIHPVSVRDEALPKQPFFDQGLQEAIKRAQGAIGKVADQLGGIDLAHDPQSGLHVLWKQALASREFNNDAISTIGIVGESAAGKSSLINSLLNLREIARTDDNGSAVTAYVTEYRYRKPHHTAPFIIEAEFLTSEEIDLELKELLYNYREAFRDGIADESGSEYEEIMRRSNVALSTLQSIFSAYDDISEDYLGDKSPSAFEDVLGHLQSLASSLDWPEGVMDGKWATTAESVDEYREKIDHLSQEGLFPLIKVVRVYLNALVLRSGVCLADMPGLGDTNLARLQAAKRYLDKCEQVFIVNRIGRAATSKTVQDAIKMQERKGMLGRKRILTVVCTGSEDIDLENAERRNRRAARAKAINLDVVKKAQDAIDEACEMNNLRAMQEAQLRYANLFITARNNSIKEDVTRNYAALASQHDLEVFCVSNRLYEGTGFNTNSAKDVARSMSRIPELRRFCHTVVAEAQFHAAIHYLDVKCLGLLQQLELWTQSTSTKEATDVVLSDCVDQLFDDLEEKLDNFWEALEDLANETILTPMKNNESEAERHAEAESDEWSAWHWSTYAAFCRNNGIHATGLKSYTNWNYDMLAKMNQAMNPQWTRLENDIEEKLKSFAEDTNVVMGQIMRRLTKGRAPQLLVDSVRTQRTDILHQLQEASLELQKNIKSTHMDAVSGDVTSFIYALMLPTYRACSGDSGKGVADRRRARMKRYLQHRTLFKNIRSNVKTQLWAQYTAFVELVRKDVQSTCAAIRQSIETIETAEAGTERANPHMLEQIRLLVVDGKEVWESIQRDSRRARERAE